MKCNTWEINATFWGRKGVQMGNLDKSNMVACKAFPPNSAITRNYLGHSPNPANPDSDNTFCSFIDPVNADSYHTNH